MGAPLQGHHLRRSGSALRSPYGVVEPEGQRLARHRPGDVAQGDPRVGVEAQQEPLPGLSHPRLGVALARLGEVPNAYARARSTHPTPDHVPSDDEGMPAAHGRARGRRESCHLRPLGGGRPRAARAQEGGPLGGGLVTAPALPPSGQVQAYIHDRRARPTPQGSLQQSCGVWCWRQCCQRAASAFLWGRCRSHAGFEGPRHWPPW